MTVIYSRAGGFLAAALTSVLVGSEIGCLAWLDKRRKQNPCRGHVARDKDCTGCERSPGTCLSSFSGKSDSMIF